MTAVRIPMPVRKRIGLVAHDRCKEDLLAWVAYNQEVLRQHDLSATGTTGALVAGCTQVDTAVRTRWPGVSLTAVMVELVDFAAERIKARQTPPEPPML